QRLPASPRRGRQAARRGDEDLRREVSAAACRSRDRSVAPPRLPIPFKASLRGGLVSFRVLRSPAMPPGPMPPGPTPSGGPQQSGAHIKKDPAAWAGSFQTSGCGARRDRTVDLLNAIQALSQLSYSPGDSVVAADPGPSGASVSAVGGLLTLLRSGCQPCLRSGSVFLPEPGGRQLPLRQEVVNLPRVGLPPRLGLGHRGRQPLQRRRNAQLPVGHRAHQSLSQRPQGIVPLLRQPGRVRTRLAERLVATDLLAQRMELSTGGVQGLFQGPHFRGGSRRDRSGGRILRRSAHGAPSIPGSLGAPRGGARWISAPPSPAGDPRREGVWVPELTSTPCAAGHPESAKPRQVPGPAPGQADAVVPSRGVRIDAGGQRRSLRPAPDVATRAGRPRSRSARAPAPRGAPGRSRGAPRGRPPPAPRSPPGTGSRSHRPSPRRRAARAPSPPAGGPGGG